MDARIHDTNVMEPRLAKLAGSRMMPDPIILPATIAEAAITPILCVSGVCKRFTSQNDQVKGMLVEVIGVQLLLTAIWQVGSIRQLQLLDH